MDVNKDISVNVFELDLEWSNLPETYHKYQEQIDICDDKIKRLKMKLEIAEAKLDKDIRKNISKYTDQAKLTESQIKAIIKTHSNSIDLQNQILDKEFYKKNCLSVCGAIAYKKDALKAIITLYSGELYCQPVLGEQSGKDFINKQKENSKRNIRKEIKRKLKKSTKEN